VEHPSIARPMLRLIASSYVRSVVVAIACGMPLAGAGCGADSDDSPSAPDKGTLEALAVAQRKSTQPLVSGTEVRAAGRSPAGTLLRWWRLIQFSAPASQITPLYTDAARPSAGSLSRQLQPIRYYFLERKPLISGQQSTARVFALIGTRSGTSTRSDPAVFFLAKSHDHWRLGDKEFVTGKYELDRRFAEEQASP
jgi:hypothetical protein